MRGLGLDLGEDGRARPLAIDLFCGLGGWAEGFLAEGYDVVGFDIERHEYGEHRYPGRLIIRDVTTLHGRRFRNAAVIVASPPCQEYSYMAMPWTLAKAKAAAILADKTGAELERLNRLFNACFRIQREACAAAGRHIPLIVENVRGAQKWVGRARWNYGSFYLWGDVPALMPPTLKAAKVPGFRFDGSGMTFQSASVAAHGTKTCGHPNIRDGHPHTKRLTNPGEHTYRPDAEGIKRPDGGGGSWFGSYAEQKARGSISPGRLHGKNSKKRKFASAMIAKIPLPLSRHVAASLL